MGIEVLKKEFDLLWAKVCEKDLELEFMEYLEEEYDLWDFERARQIIHDEGGFRV